MVLAAALFLCPAVTARAAEISTEAPAAVPTETTAPAETEPPAETTAPAETQAPAETTVPAETQPPTETTVSAETQPPVETTVPLQTEPVSTEAPARAPLSISQVLAVAPGAQDLLIQGTVVFAQGTQAVLQDSTGGIRLSFPSDPSVAPGEVLLVTGSRSGGFAVSDFELVGTARLPAVETTLLDAPENTRILVRSAAVGGGTIRQSGFSTVLVTTGAETVSGNADVCGVILDGRFYADSITPGTASVLSAVSAAPVQSLSIEEDWNLYFGLLHAHSDISDGEASVEDTFQYAAGVEGLDFFAVTDHSDSFLNAAFGSIAGDGTKTSDDWKNGKAAAQAVTTSEFVGIYGYEIAWPELLYTGHMSTFSTSGWEVWNKADSLTEYLDILTTVSDSISQFNHPGHVYGNFHAFTDYTPAYDNAVHLIEVCSENGTATSKYYNDALEQGWHLAPSNNQNIHGVGWEDEIPMRTVILAKELTEQSIYDAIRNYRVYATEDRDLEILYCLSGNIMGSILGPTEDPVVQVSLHDPTDAIGTLEVIADGGRVIVTRDIADGDAELTIPVTSGFPYYYLRITQPDGDTAVTAPVWIDDYEDMGIQSFAADDPQPVQAEEVTLTLALFNEETVPFTLEAIEFSLNGETLHRLDSPGILPALGNLTYQFPFTQAEAGIANIKVSVTGTVEGIPRTYTREVPVQFQPKEAAIRSIRDVRSSASGTAWRVKGYVTAGSENPYNTFAGTLYLQDDTGGIAVTGITVSGIEVGDAMEVTGVLRRYKNNLVLECTDYRLTEETPYRFTPRTMTNAVAMNYTAHGGELLQIEGTVVSLSKTADGKGISRFTLKDLRGDLATVVIDSNIRSGAYGTNELAYQLKKGRTIRVIGLLHMDEYGQTVLRVRNCDEVVYVPPQADTTNPKTRDPLFFWR